MNLLVLKRMYLTLIDHSDEWFDPRAGHDQMEKHAWRAVAYYLSGVEAHSESVEASNKILAEVTR